MLSWWLILLLSTAYVAVLFAIAHWGDRESSRRRMRYLRPLIYSLALGVPASLVGMSVVIQGYAFTGLANNLIFAGTNAHELRGI